MPPFDTPWDPMSRIVAQNPWLAMGQQQGQAQAPRPKIQPLGPEEEDSLLGKIAGTALGGLGYVGSVFDKALGGRAIRGLLGGRPEEALSIIPGSDWVGLTDEQNKVHGKDLLGFSPDDDSWGATLGGLATELALDPGMYMSLGAGAIGKAGQVAKKLGVLPKTATGRVTKTLKDVLPAAVEIGPPHPLRMAAEHAAGGAKNLASLEGEHLGGLLGLGLPFQHPSMLLGQGQAGADLLAGAGKAFRGADSLARATPLVGGLYGHAADITGKGLDAAGRYAGALFQRPKMGATTHMGQESAIEATGVENAIRQQSREKAGRYARSLQEAGVDDPHGELLNTVLEAKSGYAGPVHPSIQEVADAMHGDYVGAMRGFQGRGGNLQPLSDAEIAFAPRYVSPTGTGGGRGSRPLNPMDAEVAGRKELLKDIPGGKGAINQMSLDPAVHADAPSILPVAKHIRGTYLNHGAAQEQRLLDMAKIPADAFDFARHPGPDFARGIPASAEWTAAKALADERAALIATVKKSEGLADYMRGLRPARKASIGTDNPLPLFNQHPLADYETYFERMARMEGAVGASQGLLARAARRVPEGGRLPEGALRLTDALESGGLTNNPYAQQELRRRLSDTRAAKGLTSDLATVKEGELSNFFVGKDVMDELGRYSRGFQAPGAVNDSLSGFDWLTNLTKGLQTAPWPAFHLRNRASGEFGNVMMGGAGGGGEAYRLMRGGVLPEAAKIPEFAARGLTAEQATKELALEMYSRGLSGYRPSRGNEVVGPLGDTLRTGSTLDDFTNRIPGVESHGPETIAQKVREGSWNPLAGDAFGPVAGGREAGHIVEGVNRGGLYIQLRKQGYTPDAAAEQVLKSHFDYSRQGKTDFEANVLSRLIPFYRYQRGNVPFVAEQMAQHPGGVAATTARVAGNLRQQAGFLPDYLGSGLAVPVGGEDEKGTRRYLTRLDLPPEQAFEMLHGGPRGPQNSLLSLMGQVNPLIKAPLEWATGKQFFSGRDIGDLYNVTGSSTLDQLVANSPFSRAFTTARTLADERKWQDPLAALAIPLNLGTGAKVTDVDLNKQRTIAAREYVQEVLRGQPEIGKLETLYLKPGMESQLTPQELALLRLQRTIEAKAVAQRKNAGTPP